MVLSDVPSDVSAGGVLTVIVLLWGWSLRRRVP
jgi:uncharacterized protein (TIGR03382 family)